jgi:hypothetical protein
MLYLRNRHKHVRILRILNVTLHALLYLVPCRLNFFQPFVYVTCTAHGALLAHTAPARRARAVFV